MQRPTADIGRPLADRLFLGLTVLARRLGEFLSETLSDHRAELARSDGAAHRLGDPAPRRPSILFHRAAQQTLDRSAGANSDSTSSTRSMPFVTVCRREVEDPWRVQPLLPVRARPCPSLLSRRLTACGRKTLWINARARPGRRGRVSRRRSARATCENRWSKHRSVLPGRQPPASDLRRPMPANAKLRNRCTRWRAHSHFIGSRC